MEQNIKNKRFVSTKCKFWSQPQEKRRRHRKKRLPRFSKIRFQKLAFRARGLTVFAKTLKPRARNASFWKSSKTSLLEHLKKRAFRFDEMPKSVNPLGETHIFWRVLFCTFWVLFCTFWILFCTFWVLFCTCWVLFCIFLHPQKALVSRAWRGLSPFLYFLNPFLYFLSPFLYCLSPFLYFLSPFLYFFCPKTFRTRA